MIVFKQKIDPSNKLIGNVQGKLRNVLLKMAEITSLESLTNKTNIPYRNKGFSRPAVDNKSNLMVATEICRERKKNRQQ